MLKHLILAAAFLFPALAWPSVSVTVNGVSYTIPQTNERNWGTNVTSWIQAISSNTLQPSGGTFTLGADIDFGANFGLKSTYYKTRTANVSSTGQWRLADTDGIGFRNHANGGDLLLAKDTSDNLTWNGHPFLSSSGILPVAAGGTGIGSGTSGGVLAFTASGTLASSGALTASQVVIGGGAGAAPSALAAGSQFQSLVMGASAPGYSAVPLNQSAAVSGALAIANGGTGQTSQQAAIDALLPSQGSNSGKFLTTNGTTSSWGTQASQITSSSDLWNVGLALSVGSNNLTIALKQSDGATDCSSGTAACKISFNNISSTHPNGAYNQRSTTSSLSITVASGATLGSTSGTTTNYFIYALDNAGTVELAVSLGYFDCNYVVSTTALSGASSSNSVMYSTSARTNVACVNLGGFKASEATAGTWATAPTDVFLGRVNGQWRGTTTNDSASAGYVGELISGSPGGTVSTGSNNVYKTITSISLTPGDWDVEGVGAWSIGSATGVVSVNVAISTSTNATDSTSSGGIQIIGANIPNNTYLATGARRISVSSTTTVYLVGAIAYSVVGTSAWGTDSFLRARRVR